MAAVGRMTQRSAVRAGIIGVTLSALVVLAAMQFGRLWFVEHTLPYAAVFDDASGLAAGDDVEVAGMVVGKVESLRVDGGRARVAFTVDEKVLLGADTSAKIETTSLLGKRSVVLDPGTAGTLTAGSTIPLARTRSAYSLTSALGDLTTDVQGMNLDTVSQSLDAVSSVLQAGAPQLAPALDGLKRISDSINTRNQALLTLLREANSVSKTLGARGSRVNALLVDGNDLVGELNARKMALSQLISNVDAVATQLSGLVHDNEAQMGPVLTKLNTVVSILQKNRDNISTGLDGLGTYAGTLADTVASGPYFYAYIQNLIPAQYTQPLMNAVFGLPPAPLPIPTIEGPK